MNEELGVDKKILRRLAKTYHDDNFSEVADENTSFETAYKAIVG